MRRLFRLLLVFYVTPLLPAAGYSEQLDLQKFSLRSEPICLFGMFSREPPTLTTVCPGDRRLDFRNLNDQILANMTIPNVDQYRTYEVLPTKSQNEYTSILFHFLENECVPSPTCTLPAELRWLRGIRTPGHMPAEYSTLLFQEMGLFPGREVAETLILDDNLLILFAPSTTGPSITFMEFIHSSAE